MASQAIVTTEERDLTPMAKLQDDLAKREKSFSDLLPAHISPEKFQRTVITAALADPVLLQADRKSLLTACMKAAQDGLLPDKREAALVIFNNRMKDAQGQWLTVKEVQYMPMVYGLRKKILQSGEVKDIFANVVFRQEIEAGLFLYEEGTERMLRHKPQLDPAFDPSDDDIACAYSIATFEDGSQSFEVMRRAEINKVRQRSQTGALGQTVKFGANKGQPIEPKGPWVEWFSEMAKKTVMRRHSKVLPMSGDLIDLEGWEADRASRSADSVLSAVSPVAPTRIEHQDGGIEAEPPATDVASEEEVARELDEKFDPKTGEIINENAKAETARQTGGAEESEAPTWSAKVLDWTARLASVPLKADVATIIDEIHPSRVALPDDVEAGLDEAIDAAKARVGWVAK